jgi:uncharacterized protein with HEPN domain
VSSDRSKNPTRFLEDIANRLDRIHEFAETMDVKAFLEDEKTCLAVTRLMEEVCEAANWFAKNPNGIDFARRYPEVEFSNFGLAGNVFRHIYWKMDYEQLWNDIHYGADIKDLEEVLAAELPFYRKHFTDRR